MSPGRDSVLRLELRGSWVRARTAQGNPVPEKWFSWLEQNQGMPRLETTNALDTKYALVEGTLTWSP